MSKWYARHDIEFSQSHVGQVSIYRGAGEETFDTQLEAFKWLIKELKVTMKENKSHLKELEESAKKLEE